MERLQKTVSKTYKALTCRKSFVKDLLQHDLYEQKYAKQCSQTSALEHTCPAMAVLLSPAISYILYIVRFTRFEWVHDIFQVLFI